MVERHRLLLGSDVLFSYFKPNSGFFTITESRSPVALRAIRCRLAEPNGADKSKTSGCGDDPSDSAGVHTSVGQRDPSEIETRGELQG